MKASAKVEIVKKAVSIVEKEKLSTGEKMSVVLSIAQLLWQPEDKWRISIVAID